ncbi:MAG: TetR/AcrR family transcriptional regulator [Synergistaceae bacterium]|nr:TetR/AcrR family transcriptional regulator [Synergistaceae bacterium]
MARPPQDPQIRINEILDAAEALFYEHGYHPTMISDIVKKIGVAQGTFYYYFSSKEEIVDALINRHLSKFKAAIDEVTNSADISLSRKIELMANIMLATIQGKQGLLLEFLYNDRYLHLMDKVFRQTKKILAPNLLSVIKEGKRKQIFSVSYPKAVADSIMSIIQCYIEALYEKEAVDLLEYQNKLAKYLIKNALGLIEGDLQIPI